MLRLLLLRHAKSAWNQPGLDDFDRSLSPRGRSGAPLIADHVLRRGYRPGRVLCSAALRTRETLGALLPALTGNLSIEVLRSLYDGAGHSYLDIIRRHGGSAAGLLVIGHNPTIHDTALELSGSGEPALIEDLRSRFPTAALAVIDLPAEDWRSVEPGSGTLVDFVTPHDLGLPGGD